MHLLKSMLKCNYEKVVTSDDDVLDTTLDTLISNDIYQTFHVSLSGAVQQ